MAKQKISDVASDVSQEQDTPVVADALENTERSISAQKILNLDLDLLAREIEQGYREVLFDNQTYHIYFPTMDEESKIAKFKSKVTSDLLKDPDVMLAEEILDTLKERKVWDKDKAKQESDFQKRLGEIWALVLSEEAKEKPDHNKLEELKKERMLLQLELDMLAGRKKQFLENSLESQVEAKVNFYKLYICTKTIDRTPAFESYDAFQLTDRKLQNTLLLEGLTFWSGMNRAMFNLALSD